MLYVLFFLDFINFWRKNTKNKRISDTSEKTPPDYQNQRKAISQPHTLNKPETYNQKPNQHQKNKNNPKGQNEKKNWQNLEVKISTKEKTLSSKSLASSMKSSSFKSLTALIFCYFFFLHFNEFF